MPFPAETKTGPETSAIESAVQALLDPAKRNPRPRGDALFGYLDNVPAIHCADGFSMSIQTSLFHYCSPRDSEGPWSSVEIGFPSQRVEALMPFIDGGPDENPSETVYGYVPLSIVAAVIAEHGGIVAGPTMSAKRAKAVR